MDELEIHDEESSEGQVDLAASFNDDPQLNNAQLGESTKKGRKHMFVMDSVADLKKSKQIIQNPMYMAESKEYLKSKN